MPDQSSISKDVIEALLIPSTATITALLSGHGLRNTFMHDVAPLKPGMKMAGPAFTMRYIPAREDLTQVPMDNLTDIQRIGIEQIETGEVLSSTPGVKPVPPSWEISWRPGSTCAAR